MKETAVAVCVSLLLIAAVASPGQAPASRRAVSSGRPIIDQLRPDDRELTLEINAYPPFVLPAPPGQSRLAWLTEISQIVLVIVVDDKRAHLTEPQTWIRSRVRARVERMLKPSPRVPVQEGHFILFEEDGGVLLVAQRRVEAVVPWARPLQRKGRYLVFGTVTDDGALVAGPSSTYEEGKDGLLHRVMHSNPDVQDEIEQAGLQAAIDGILAAVATR